jgi:hypothetical protein
MSKAKIIVIVSILILSMAMGTNQTAFAESNNKMQLSRAKNISGRTKQIITLKGIPFGEAGVRDDVLDLCERERPDWDTTPCELENGWIFFGEMQFGNLSAHASTKLDELGSLDEFELEGSSSEMQKLATLLTEKYGPPRVFEETVSNQLGHQFPKWIYMWRDAKGTRMIVETIHQKVDRGRVIIQSKKVVELIEAENKEREDRAKNNL